MKTDKELKLKLITLAAGIVPTILLLGLLKEFWWRVIYYESYMLSPPVAFPKNSFFLCLINALLLTFFWLISLSIFTYKMWGYKLSMYALKIIVVVYLFIFFMESVDSLAYLPEKLSMISKGHDWEEKRNEFLRQWTAWYGPVVTSFLSIVALGLAIYQLKKREIMALFN